jgi:hypothetical protein
MTVAGGIQEEVINPQSESARAEMVANLRLEMVVEETGEEMGDLQMEMVAVGTSGEVRILSMVVEP